MAYYYFFIQSKQDKYIKYILELKGEKQKWCEDRRILGCNTISVFNKRQICYVTAQLEKIKATFTLPQPLVPASPLQYCGGWLETDNWGAEIQQYRSHFLGEKGYIPEVSAKGLNRLQNTCKVFCSALQLFCFTCCNNHYRELYLSDSIPSLYLIT